MAAAADGRTMLANNHPNPVLFLLLLLLLATHPGAMEHLREGQRLHSPHTSWLCSPPPSISCFHLDPDSAAPTARDASLLCCLLVHPSSRIINNPTCSTTLGPAGCWQGCPLQSMLVGSSSSSQCEPTKHAQGGPGSPGWGRRSRIAKGRWWTVNHGHTDRDPNLWGGHQAPGRRKEREIVFTTQ